MSLSSFLTVLLLIGVIHCHVVRRAAITLEDAEKKIADIEEKAKQFQEIVQKVDDQVNVIVNSFKEKVKPFIKNFEVELSSKTKIMENRIQKLTNLNLSNSTCGILSIEEILTKSVGLADDCAEKTFEETVKDLHNVLGNTKEIADSFTSIRAAIEKCKQIEGSDNIKVDCIKKAYDTFSVVLPKVENAASLVKSAFSIIDLPRKFKSCLAKSAGIILIANSNSIIKCASDKFPDIQKNLKELNDITIKYKNDVTQGIENVYSSVKDGLKEANKKAKQNLDSLKQKMDVFKKDAEETAKHVKESLDKFWKEVVEYSCKLCPSCYFCPHCSSCQ